MESVAKVSGNFYKIPKPCNGQTLHVVLIEIEMLNRKKGCVVGQSEVMGSM